MLQISITELGSVGKVKYHAKSPLRVLIFLSMPDKLNLQFVLCFFSADKKDKVFIETSQSITDLLYTLIP